MKHVWAASWQNQQSGMCAQQRLRSAWASAQSDQSSLCTQWVAKDPSFLHAQSDQSLRCPHMPFCWFCHEEVHLESLWIKHFVDLYRIMWMYSEFFSKSFYWKTSHKSNWKFISGGICFMGKYRCETDYLAPCGCLLHACNVVPMVTEKLRQNDETLKEVLEERQSLIAELLHVQPSDVTDKVKVSA